jgi:hypothetical protein
MQLSVPDAKIVSKVNEPVYEILRVFAAEQQKHMELPRENDLICATTANSGNENEAVLALNVIGKPPHPESTILSTIKEDGKTGVSNVMPFHAAVVYNNHTVPVQEWTDDSESLFDQLCKQAGQEYHTIFHSPSASTTERGAHARTVGAPPSVSTTDGGANARGTSICEHNRERSTCKGVPPSASTTECGASAWTAGAPPSVPTAE